MDTNGLSAEQLADGLNVANNALLFTLVKRVCANNPELIQHFFAEATTSVDAGVMDAESKAIGAFAKDVLSHWRDAMLPKRGGGF